MKKVSKRILDLYQNFPSQSKKNSKIFRKVIRIFHVVVENVILPSLTVTNTLCPLFIFPLSTNKNDQPPLFDPNFSSLVWTALTFLSESRHQPHLDAFNQANIYIFFRLQPETWNYWIIKHALLNVQFA